MHFTLATSWHGTPPKGLSLPLRACQGPGKGRDSYCGDQLMFSSQKKLSGKVAGLLKLQISAAMFFFPKTKKIACFQCRFQNWWADVRRGQLVMQPMAVAAFCLGVLFAPIPLWVTTPITPCSLEWDRDDCTLINLVGTLQSQPVWVSMWFLSPSHYRLLPHWRNREYIQKENAQELGQCVELDP